MTLEPYSVEVWLQGAFPSEDAVQAALNSVLDAATAAGFIVDGAQSGRLPERLVIPGSPLAKQLEDQ